MTIFRRKVSPNLEGGLLGSLSVLQTVIPLLSDSILMKVSYVNRSLGQHLLLYPAAGLGGLSKCRSVVLNVPHTPVLHIHLYLQLRLISLFHLIFVNIFLVNKFDFVPFFLIKTFLKLSNIILINFWQIMSFFC